VSVTTGKKLWSWSIPGDGLTWHAAPGIAASPAVAYGLVYIASDDGNVYALHSRTGKLVWKFATGHEIAAASPTVANGVVYQASYDYNVYALDARTGAKLWSYETGNIMESSPTVLDGVVYLPAEDNVFYAFSLDGHAPEPCNQPSPEVTVEPLSNSALKSCLSPDHAFVSWGPLN
jgi:outer membrane protein assembly factor BamB